MRIDGDSKVTFGLISMALMTLMTLAVLGAAGPTASPDSVAHAPPSSTATEELTGSNSALGNVATLEPSSAGQSVIPTTYPLRWRVLSAHQQLNATENNYCATAVTVQHASPSELNIEVEVDWRRDFDNLSDGVRTSSLAPGSWHVFVTSDRPHPPWFNFTDSASLGFAYGYANVHASDPRILVSAFYYCRVDDIPGSPLIAMTNVPAMPVGPTAEFFLAGSVPQSAVPTPTVEPSDPDFR